MATQAEVDAHPTTRLGKLQADLAAHTGDINDRLAAVQRGLAGLIGLMLENSQPAPKVDPAPVMEKDDGK